MTLNDLLARAASDDLARLRWHLCRAFCVPPWSPGARSLTDEACLTLAAHLLLDRAALPEHGAAGQNPNFDDKTFQARKGGAL